MANQKNVKVIARIQFKADPRKACYLVRSSNGSDQYTTCLFAGKATGCSCPATGKCYHRTQVEAIEQERTRKAALAQAQAESAAELARIDAEVQAAIADEQAKAVAEASRTISEQAQIATLDTKAEAFASLKNRYDYRQTSKHRQSAPLAGASKGFSLLK